MNIPLSDEELIELANAINATNGTPDPDEDGEEDTDLDPTEPDIEQIEPFPLP